MEYLVNIFEALDNSILLLQGKNTNLINDCDAIHTFMEKLGHHRVKKASSFLSVYTVLQKTQIELEGEFMT